ncbi:MAG: hypothetical protein JSV56_00890 [Methanomassiliicoccales archaeon]|nr:MAG: hypothetical protein JSV56_00890 [Methanomassiliicoccales archaeon]
MAKKRRKSKEEAGYEFKEPEFDEKEYLKKEVRDTKTLFVTFGYALLMAFASFGLTFVDVALAALLGIIGIVFLRHIYPLIGVDTSLLEKKQWGSNIIMYLFTWLLVWILLCNPPISDFAKPTIKRDGIYFGGPGNWTKLNDTNEIDYTMNVSINATIVDNVEVDEKTIIIIIREKEGDEFIEKERSPMNRIGKNKYAYVVSDLKQRPYEYTISAEDVNNLETSLSGNFYVY